MAIGFNIGTVEVPIIIRPDKNLSRSTSPRVLRASFGDGYEQRLADGINTLAESYSVSFNNRTKEEIDDIVAFFDAKKAVTAFEFTIPDSNNAGQSIIKVVCDSYNLNYTVGDFYGCSATFRRVYEA